MKSLKSVKPEIRILGLDSCNPRVIIGAIVRGGRYLDGVLAFSKKNSPGKLAREITETMYFPELRIIMVHNPNGSLNASTIQRITQLPLINISIISNDRAKSARSSGPKQHRERNQAGLDPTLLRRILELTQAKGHLPEPVRIAHLLSKLRFFEGISKIRDKFARDL